MPVHDWTRVEAGIFHALHFHWTGEIDAALNAGVLPPGYYSLPEQVAGVGNPDVLTLQLSAPVSTPDGNGTPVPDPVGGVALATAPPRVQFHDRADGSAYVRKTRSVVIRHTSGHRIVAIVEVVSPGNKASNGEMQAIVTKAVQFLRAGIHLLILDVFPPGPRDPQGLHPLIWSEFKTTEFALPVGKPLTLAAYAAGPVQQAFIEPVAVGELLPEMPLFLTPDVYVPVPLEATYSAAFRRLARPWRDVIEPPG